MIREQLTLRQVAEVLQIRYHRAAELARTGLLPGIRLGRQIRVSPDQLEEFLANGGKPLPGGWKRKTY
jgi:excisionase family DNA binding protein